MLLLHVAIVAAVSWVALGFALAARLLLLLIAVSHFAIDWAKLRFGGAGFGPFVADQARALRDDRARRGALPRRLRRRPLGPAAPTGARRRARRAAARRWRFAAGFIAAVWAGDYAVQGADVGLHARPTPASLPKGGRLIGRLERR